MRDRAVFAWLRAVGLALVTSAVVAGPGFAEPVDLELVLAIDVSRSIDLEEARLQREGYVAAFSDKRIIDAIQTGRYGRIAVAYVEWAEASHRVTIIDWTLVSDEASARAFASALGEAPISQGFYTSVSGAIDFAAPLFDKNDFEGARKVIDVSGDGPNNNGRSVAAARDEAVAAGITINGLPIINDKPSPGGWPPMKDLDVYYENCVIGGPRAFVIVAEGFPKFAQAIRRKLVIEIADLRPAGKGRRAATAGRPLIVRHGLLSRVQGQPMAPPCDSGDRQFRRGGSGIFN